MGCMAILWSSLVPIVLVPLMVMQTSEIRTVVRVILQVVTCVTKSPWPGILTWVTHLMNPLSANLRYWVMYRFMVGLNSLLCPGDVVNTLNTLSIVLKDSCSFMTLFCIYCDLWGCGWVINCPSWNLKCLIDWTCDEFIPAELKF